MVKTNSVDEELRDAKSVLSKVKKRKITEGIIRQEARVRTLKTRKSRVDQRGRIGKRVGRLADKAVSGELKFMKEKFLKKPKAKGPAPISARKTLKGFAQSTGPLVREVERQEVVQDDRSQFFKEEFAQEERGVSKWLS